MESKLTVYDAMTRGPVTVTPDTNMIDCAKLMKAKRVGSLVVKEGLKFVGIITEQDMVRRAILNNHNLQETLAKHIMTTDVILASPGMDVFDVIKSMRDYDIRHMPVVDEGKLFGLITMKDVLKVQPDLFELLIEKFDLAEESRKPIYNITGGDGVCRLCGKYSASLKMTDGVLACNKCH